LQLSPYWTFLEVLLTILFFWKPSSAMAPVMAGILNVLKDPNAPKGMVTSLWYYQEEVEPLGNGAQWKGVIY
jgi:hypothetical protein